MNKRDLEKIIDDHGRWLRDEPNGKRADLRSADLRSADLRYADLRYADLRYADLRYANLRSADLRSADLRSADLRYADLKNTILAKRQIQCLSEAIELAKEIFSNNFDYEAVADEKNLYVVPGEQRAVIAFSKDLSGGFCFIHHRKEIWWWNWMCPNPETVTVLWKMEEKQ